jgi:hypothetical protein
MILVMLRQGGQVFFVVFDNESIPGCSNVKRVVEWQQKGSVCWMIMTYCIWYCEVGVERILEREVKWEGEGVGEFSIEEIKDDIINLMERYLLPSEGVIQ